MKHRSPDRPRRVDGDSPFADRILTPRGTEIGHQEGRAGVAGVDLTPLAMADQADFVAAVAPSGGWRPIQSP
jgi:hypothetical protein